MKDSAVILILCTVPDQATAEKIGCQLIENHLAACVNVIPDIHSIYEWKGKLTRDEELLLLIKSSNERLKEIIDFIRQAHPYEMPEVIAFTVTNGSLDYLKWVVQTTKSTADN